MDKVLKMCLYLERLDIRFAIIFGSSFLDCCGDGTVGLHLRPVHIWVEGFFFDFLKFFMYEAIIDFFRFVFLTSLLLLNYHPVTDPLCLAQRLVLYRGLLSCS